MEREERIWVRIAEPIELFTSFCLFWFIAWVAVIIVIAIITLGKYHDWELWVSILFSFVLGLIFTGTVVLLTYLEKTIGPYYYRRKLPMKGPSAFCQSVERVLQELQNNAPHRYQEVIHYLPQAKYDSSIAPRASGLSDGRFSVDGSGDNGKQLNTYEWFRFVFLHEVGHVVNGKKGRGDGEAAADRYANTVLEEIGFPPYR